MSSTLGLILIIAGWGWQLKMLWRGSKALSQNFLILYGLGVLFLSYDSHNMGLDILAFLNLVCFAAAGLTWFKSR